MAVNTTSGQYQRTLEQIGLTPNQAAIYEVLLKIGPSPAGKVAQNSPYKRPLTYKILEELQDLSLVEKREEPSRVATFGPLHPSKLNELLETKIKRAEAAKYALGSVIGQLTSDFNLISGKPGVQFFEGKEGIEKVSFDSLQTKGEIYTYVDSEAVDKYIPNLDLDYVKRRKKLGIKKKILAPDSESIRSIAKNNNDTLTEIKVVPKRRDFATVMQVYDDKVSFITMGEKSMIAILIQDQFISAMHKDLFENLWENAKPPLGNTTPQPVNEDNPSALV